MSAVAVCKQYTINQDVSRFGAVRRECTKGELQQSRRMETLGGMAARIAHDINYLMSLVSANLELACALPSSERQADQLARAVWGAERVRRLTQQMLSFSYKQSDGAHRAELRHLIESLESLIAQVSGTGVDVQFDLTPKPLPVMVNAGQFDLALLNLVRNAVGAMQDRGTLTISTDERDLDGEGQFVTVTVSDTGVGMTPEVMRRATEPFFTTKLRGRGTGLGLSMVQGFAEQSGGRLEMESAPNWGTRVTLVLPRCR
jgi:signal transduction histidine kinase